ncbi:hypothetical protein IJ596_05710 [bacterium]|nr:hypothetical protein [bacterium]
MRIQSATLAPVCQSNINNRHSNIKNNSIKRNDIIPFGESFHEAEDSGGIIVDLAILACVLGLPLGGVGACAYTMTKNGELENNKRLEYAFRETSEDKLMNIFTRDDSESGGIYSPNEQKQAKKMLNDKEGITKDFPAKSYERGELEEYYNNKLLDKYSESNSDSASQFTQKEQRLILDFMEERAKLLKK